MNRSLSSRVLRVSIFVALSAIPAAAAAQSDDYTSYSDTWIDVHDGAGGSGGARTRPTTSGGPGSLAEARTSGGGMVISGDHPHDVPATHTVRTGDTLWEISEHYYGNPYEWPRLWSYNPEITNPHWIYPQDQVRLAPQGAATVTTAAGPRVRVASHGPREPQDTVWLRESGWLDQEALRTAGTVIGSPTDHMLMSPYDQVYVHFDELEGGRAPEGEFTIFREIEARDREPGEQGTLVRILGTVRIDTWDQDRHTARATLTEALEPIERGYRVAAVPRRFEVVPPVRADRDLSTSVVASLTPHVLLGSDQIVFVPVGEDDGLQLGHRLFVVRAGDEWRRTLSQIDASPDRMGTTVTTPSGTQDWPDEVIAEARVISLRPHSAGLFITRATRTVEVGDRAELREGY